MSDSSAGFAQNLERAFKPQYNRQRKQRGRTTPFLLIRALMGAPASRVVNTMFWPAILFPFCILPFALCILLA